jgi:hypothetical protein
MATPVPVDLTPTATPGGLLAAAGNLPAGWERGISFLDPNCITPVAMGECPTGEYKPTQRVGFSTFRPVDLVVAVECTARGNLDLRGMAGRELDRVRSFALAREMLTAEASARDASDPDHANPSLVGTATDLGADFLLVATALACLERNIGESFAGRGGVILVGPDVATHLLYERVIWRDGARWMTASGNRVIIDPGFDGRAPGSSAPPDPTDPAYMYAVGDVWASVGGRDTLYDVDRSVNTASARAEDGALAAFPTCAVFAAASTTATVC